MRKAPDVLSERRSLASLKPDAAGVCGACHRRTAIFCLLPCGLSRYSDRLPEEATTFGQLVHFHPHIHALVTDGAFAPDGRSIPMPAIDARPSRSSGRKGLRPASPGSSAVFIHAALKHTKRPWMTTTRSPDGSRSTSSITSSTT